MNNNFVDSKSTTLDWQKLPQPIAVLPIGATEQHGSHLPLCTDAVEAQYFAKVIAENLGAALLPAISIAQSLEHKGFRGTISLRPDTLKQLVCDIIDELESQGFTRLVIINAHGGNFALSPAVREINRQDRKIKIVLANFWEYDSSEDGKLLGEGEVHAGAWETSVMLAIAPELVGNYKDFKAKKAPFEAKQSDLNHFGIGVLKPSGVWGQPEKACPEAGKAIVRSITENLTKAVKQRLNWMEQNSSYDAGAVTIRPMIQADTAAGFRLSLAAGWNQMPADWDMLFSLCTKTAFVAVCSGEVVGTITTVDYDGKLGWIGMVLVDEKMQRRGIATSLMKTAIESLKDIKTFKLDATAAGKGVYEKLGFVEEFGISRFAVDTAPLPEKESLESSQIRQMNKADIEAVAALDAAVFGVNRKAVLEHLLGLAPQYAFVFETRGKITGFAMGRKGAKYELIGPVGADDLQTAKALINSVLNNMQGRSAAIDTPDKMQPLNNWLQSLSFCRKRSFVRMHLPSDDYPCDISQMFAIAGPELG